MKRKNTPENQNPSKKAPKVAKVEPPKPEEVESSDDHSGSDDGALEEFKFKDFAPQAEETYEEYFEALTAEQKKAIESLEALQKKIAKVHEDRDAEIDKIFKKFATQEEPHFAARTKLAEGVPDFWIRALRSNGFINKHMSPLDSEILKHLTNIKSLSPSMNDFDLEFTFSPNKYFENKTLRRTFILNSGDAGADPNQPDFKKNETTEIKWTDEGAKDETLFFELFTKNENPEAAAEDEDDEEDPFDLKEDDIDSFEVSRMIKESIIPDAAILFKREPVFDLYEDEGEDGEDGPDFGDDDDEDDDDEDDDDDDDESEEEQPKKQGKGKGKPIHGKSKGHGPGKEQEKPEECKQQ